MSKRTHQQLLDDDILESPSVVAHPTRRRTRSQSTLSQNSLVFLATEVDTNDRKKRRTGANNKQPLTSSKSRKPGYFPERLYSVIQENQNEPEEDRWVLWLGDNVFVMQHIYHLAQELTLKESSLRAELRKHSFTSVKLSDQQLDAVSELEKTHNGIEASLDAFTHESFIRGDLESVRSIKRKAKAKRGTTLSSSSSSSSPSDIHKGSIFVDNEYAANAKQHQPSAGDFMMLLQTVLDQKVQEIEAKVETRMRAHFEQQVESRVKQEVQRVLAQLQSQARDGSTNNNSTATAAFDNINLDRKFDKAQKSPETTSAVLNMDHFHIMAKKEPSDDLSISPMMYADVLPSLERGVSADMQALMAMDSWNLE